MGRGSELEIMEPGDGEFDPFEPTEDDAVVRSPRKISITAIVTTTVEVIEPPQVHDAELKAHLRLLLMRATTNLSIGVPTNINVEVRSGRRGA